jgi:chromosome segregation ATPase
MGENALNFDSVVDAEYEKPGEVVTTGSGLDLDVIRPRFDDYKREAKAIVASASALAVTDDKTLADVVELGGRAKRIAANIEAQRKAIIAEPQEYIDGVNGICRSITESLVVMKNSKKDITNPQCAENVLKGKYAQYQSRLEMERLERERKAREEAAALQRKLDEEAAEANRKAAEEARKRAEEEQRIKREKEEAEARERGAKKAEMEALAKKAEAERLLAIRQAEEEAEKNAVQAPVVAAPVVQEAPRVTRTEAGSASQRKVWEFRVVDPLLVPREFLLVSDNKVRDAVKMGTRSIPGIEIFETSKTVFRT